MSDKTDKPKPPRGPKSIFHIFGGKLGPSKHGTIRWPEQVVESVDDDEVKVLLGWMALKPENRARALKLIPAKLRAMIPPPDNPSPSVSSEPVLSQNPADSTDTGL